MQKGFLLTLLFFCYLGQLIAQSDSSSCGLCRNGIHRVKSPYAFSFKSELPFALSGIGIVGASFLIQANNNTDPYTPAELAFLDPNDVNAFDRGAIDNFSSSADKASTYIRAGVTMLPALFLTNKQTRHDIVGLAAITLEVAAINYGITNAVKHLTNRTRPLVYNEQAPTSKRTDKDSLLSFFSGHVSHTAAISFMMAKIWSDYHPDMAWELKVGLWTVAASVPAVLGYLRVRSGEHFPTDVIAAYFSGALIGWLIPHLHKKKTSFKVAPYSSDRAQGVSFFYRF